jgi:ribosomal protein L14E/L6E/L27E
MERVTIPVGTAVQSCAGRDKNGLYVVVGTLDYPYVWIADGRKYNLDKPKKKNYRHLRVVGTSVSRSDAGTYRISNEWIRSVLNRIRDEMTREVLHV